jgi:hypothetical protein
MAKKDKHSVGLFSTILRNAQNVASDETLINYNIGLTQRLQTSNSFTGNPDPPHKNMAPTNIDHNEFDMVHQQRWRSLLSRTPKPQNLTNENGLMLMSKYVHNNKN